MFSQKNTLPPPNHPDWLVFLDTNNNKNKNNKKKIYSKTRSKKEPSSPFPLIPYVIFQPKSTFFLAPFWEGESIPPPKSQPRKIQFLPTSCWLNFSAPIFFVWLLHIFARTQTKETPSDLCTFDLAIGLFVFLGYFFFLFLLISPHCGYFFLLLSLGSWVFMVNFPSKWMLFCLHSNS